MADEIVSTLGFSCDTALTALDKLDAALKKVDATMQAFSVTASAFDGSKFDALSKIKTGIDGTVDSVRQLDLSFGAVGKIVASRIISQGIYAVKDALQETVGMALDLQQQMEKIHLFSGGVSAGALEDQVKNLSAGLAMPIEQVSKGLGQAFRANLGTSSDALMLFRSSADLAKGSLSELGVSVDAVGGVLKGFGLQGTDSAEVASKLLRVSQDSKTELDGLAQVYGKLAPLAKTLGISFDEVSASFISLSNAGVSSSQAGAIVERTLRSLAKPSADLSAAIHNLGFANSEAMLSTLKWGGALQALALSTDGSGEALMRLSAGGRGANALFSLGTASAQAYSDALKKLQSTSSEYASQAAGAILSTDAGKVTQAIEKIKVAMTSEFGERLISVLASASKSADFLASAIRVAAETVTAVTPLVAASTLAWASGLNKAALAGNALAGAVSSIATGVAAVTAAWAVGSLIGAEFNSQQAAAIQRWHDQEERVMQALKVSEAARIKALDDESAHKIQALLAANIEAGKLYTAELDVAQRTGTTIEKEIEARLNRMVQAREKYARALVSAEERAADQIRASQNREAQAKEAKSELQFRIGQEGKSPEDQIKRLIGEGLKLSDQANSLMAASARKGDTAGTARANNLFSRAEQYEREAAAQAKSAGQTDQVVIAQSTLSRILDVKVAAEERLQKIEAKRTADLAAEADYQQSITDQMKAQAAVAAENSKILDKNGHLKSAEQLSRMDSARRDALAKMEGLGFSPEDLQRAGGLGVAKDLQKSLAEQPTDLKLSVENSITEIRARLDNVFANYRARLNFDLGALERIVGHPVNGQEQLGAALKEAQQRQAKQQQAFSESATQPRAKIEQIRKEIGGYNAAGIADGVDPLGEKMVALSQSSAITKQNLLDVASQIQVILSKGEGWTGSPTARLQVIAYSELLDKLQQIRDLQTQINSAAPPPSDQYQQFLDQSQPVGRAHGGSIYFADGGRPRGTDTIGALLSPGEMVMSASSVRHFGSQLAAMNAGVAPSNHYSHGGTTYNVSVGDVNVVGGETPRQNGRAVASEIKREMRRGTANL
jgi:TP901 family phage tail tape measure protein